VTLFCRDYSVTARMVVSSKLLCVRLPMLHSPPLRTTVRVFLLLFRMARPERPLGTSLARAAAWTFVVPVATGLVNTALHAMRPGLPSQTIWLVYELLFLAMALWLRGVRVPSEVGPNDPVRLRALQSVAGYVAVYYALWALADVLILVFGLDAGWLLRVVPNQLYYAFWLPFAWFQLAGLR